MEGIQYFALSKITIIFEESAQVYSVISPMVECYAGCGKAFDEFLADYYFRTREIITSFVKNIMREMKIYKEMMKNQWVMIRFNFHEDNRCHIYIESSLGSLFNDSEIDEVIRCRLMRMCREFQRRIEEVGDMIEDRLFRLTDMM